jgi:phosphatidylserine decarboxylase
MSDEGPALTLAQRLHTWLLYLLPHHLLSRLMYAATRWRFRPWKNAQIGWVMRRYRVDMSEALESDHEAYSHFNDFFTRALKPGARPIASQPDALCAPSDGVISQLGAIRDGRLVQAKGHDYTVAELLGDAADARSFAHGSFATVYLAPRDYHRVHMPATGTLTLTRYIPGRLFSVAMHTTRSIPHLFARNERLVTLFDSEHGPLAVVLVGALFVGSMSTVWGGQVTPPYRSRILSEVLRARGIELTRGAEMGRFNMGSTVIVLSARPIAWSSGLTVGATTRVGALLGTVLP